MKRFMILMCILAGATALHASPLMKARVAKTHGTQVFTKINTPLQDSEKSVQTFVKNSVLPEIATPMLTPLFVKTFSRDGKSIYRYAHTYNGIPVEGSFTSVALQNGMVYRVMSSAVSFTLDTTNLISSEKAAAAAWKTRSAESTLPKFWAERKIIKHFGTYHVAWKIRFAPTSLADTRFYYVDAKTGNYLKAGQETRFAGTNMAKVFEINPKRTPEPIEVELPWVSDDSQGYLTAAKDENNVRLVVAANCVDEGQMVAYPGYGNIPVCTVKQIANKETNASFIYEDWTKGVAYQFDASDVYAEVSMYYHVSKIYKYLRELGVGGFKYLGGHNLGTANPNPLIALANFQMPSSATAIAPMDNAFFSPNQPGFNDIFFKGFKYQGDVMVFGQGSKADFGYDGEVIYHEFGHAVEAATSNLDSFAYPDQYGFCNVPLGINEGVADTISFMVNMDPCLGEYTSEGIASMGGASKYGDFYCMRYADNDNLPNEDFNGESHNDGLPLVGANYDIAQLLLKNGVTKDDFVRLVLNTLISLTDSQSGYDDYAQAMLSEAENTTVIAPFKADIEKILNDKKFSNTVRARDLSKEKVQYIFSGGTATGTGAPETSFYAMVKGEEKQIAPAYIQFYFDMPACTNKLIVSGRGQSNSQMGSGSAKPKYDLYMRKGEPVLYNIEEYPTAVTVDEVVAAESNTYTLKNLEPGKRYYLQFVNNGGDGLVVNIGAEASKEGTIPGCEGETSDSDSLISDTEVSDAPAGDTVLTPDTENKKSSSSGCSLTEF